MARTTRYSQEVRERAVRMVFEQRGEYDSEWEAIGSIAEKIGCSAETLRKWIRQTQVDSGCRSGLTSDERGRMKEAIEMRHASTARTWRALGRRLHVGALGGAAAPNGWQRNGTIRSLIPRGS